MTCTIKYLKAGGQIAARFTEPTEYNMPLALTVDDQGNVYVTGTSKQHTTSPYEIATVKYDPSLNQVWTPAPRYTGMGGDNIPVAVAADAQGNVYVAATVHSFDYSSYSSTIIKYNQAGQQVWDQSYRGPQGARGARAADLKLDPQGNAYVTGYYLEGDLSNDKRSLFTIKYSPAEGDVVWTDISTDPACDVAGRALAVDAAGEVYGLGDIYNLTTKIGDLLTVKYLSGGGRAWTARYGEAGRNLGDSRYASFLLVDQQRNIYVAGTVQDPVITTANPNYVTLKYRQLFSVSATIGLLLWDYGPYLYSLWAKRNFDTPAHSGET